jgi:hypothetical protein
VRWFVKTFWTWAGLCSCLSVAMLWLMGSRSLYGPVLGLCSQCAWTGYLLTKREWGLAPAVAAFWLVHLRNLILWM